tara:strand:- start:1276 stop:1602 length:327 start_codon:yes stop_codon:yes gene_type:complete
MGVLLLCSLLTHILLLCAVKLTSLLGLNSSAPSALSEIQHFGKINNTILHFVGLSSISVFILGQIGIFYLLINYSPAVKKILYRRKTQNPYYAPQTLSGNNKLSNKKD